MLTGELVVLHGFGTFPVLVDNIIGGKMVFTMTAWAQVANEVSHR